MRAPTSKVTAAAQSPFPPRPAERSPFPRASLPQPGESLREAALDLVLGKIVTSGAVAVTLGFVAMHAWLMWWLDIPVSPWVWTVAAAALGTWATWQYFRTKPQLAALTLGVRGEREVGRMLEELRVLGYAVFHDIPGDGFNVDHALIGPAGVFAIETKTISKPTGRRAEISYDGKHVLVDGHAPDRDPVAQASAIADYLGGLLKRMTDRAVDVRPVVLYPGWWVTRKSGDGRVWVLNEKALGAFLEQAPARLSREDIALFTDRLTLHLSSD